MPRKNILYGITGLLAVIVGFIGKSSYRDFILSNNIYDYGIAGWLKDKFGISWQVIPTILSKLLSDPARSGRVTEAFLKMKKFDIEKLKNA